MKNLLLLLCGLLLAGCQTERHHHKHSNCCCCNCCAMRPGLSPQPPAPSWQPGSQQIPSRPLKMPPGISPSMHMWTSKEPAAPGSMEFKLRSKGKHWEKVPDEIKVGSIVQDIYEPRMNQPVGRGAIGKVVKVLKGDRGQPVAKVDFGRDYTAEINFSELSRVKITGR